MSELLGWAFVAVASLLLIIWLGPHVLLWVLNRFIDRYNRRIAKFQADQKKRHDDIREALEILRRAREQR